MPSMNLGGLRFIAEAAPHANPSHVLPTGREEDLAGASTPSK